MSRLSQNLNLNVLEPPIEIQTKDIFMEIQASF